MQSFLSYARAFNEKYGVRFVGVRMMDVSDDLTSSNFLVAYFRAAYVRYIRTRKVMVNQKCVVSLLMNLGRDEPTGKTMGIINFDGLSI